MAALAIVGSHHVNGVAELHTQILRSHVFRDFHALWPERFSNKTNGITQRRLLLKSNPALADLIGTAIGSGWVTDLDELSQLAPLAEKQDFGAAWRKAKRDNKERLADTIRRDYQRRGVALSIDPDSLFDVQAKRIHEYKRQLLNVMHVIHEYLGLIEDNKEPTVPRTYIFAG